TKMQDHMIALDLLQKVRFRIVGWIVTAPGDTPEDRSCACMSESGPEIADDVSEFVAVAQLNHFIVGIFEVPVVDQRHHDLQTLKLRRPKERIAFPLPLA